MHTHTVFIAILFFSKVDSSLSNNEGYTNALRALESYHITNKNYSEAGKCVEEIIVKEIAVGNKNKVKELALAAIEYYNKDKMWECGVQVQRLVSDVVKLDEKESPLSESIEKTCDPGVRIFPVYFYVEVTVDGESTESYIVKGRPTDKLVNCKEAVMERWPDCVVKGFGEYCADNAPKGKRFVSIHPCSPSKLEESFANENNLPKGIWVSNVVDGTYIYATLHFTHINIHIFFFFSRNRKSFEG